MSETALGALADAVRKELTDDIVPFWLGKTVDQERGGFIARLSNDLVVDVLAPKGLILNTRILWSFSAFYRRFGDPACLAMAERALQYLEERFWDATHGGLYWMVDAQGQPYDAKKKVYGQAFFIYALAEYHRATGSKSALARAREVFELLEARARDARHDGYFESYERDWRLSDDLRLSDSDLNEKKSMNTHLHVLEAYASLARVWPDARVRQRLQAVIGVFLDRIVDASTNHFHLFFDEDWSVKSDEVSFGHDIEGSWLLCEAADISGDTAVLTRTRRVALAMAEAVLREGVEADGGVLNEGHPREATGTYKDWWPQAEAVVGFLNAFELSGERRYWDAAQAAWRFIETHILDREHGEWFWGVLRDGRPDPAQPKISEWKCPYHNGRMCLETMDRIERLSAGRATLAGR
jgi:mannobiose 2-epimerase